MRSEIENKLIDFLKPAIDAMELILWDIELLPGKVLIKVDRTGGVDLEQLSAATGTIRHLIDNLNWFDGYSRELEVSSPGLEAKLRIPDHFQKSIGRKILIKLHEASGGARTIRGELIIADYEGCVVISEDGIKSRILYGDMLQAKTIFDWPVAPTLASRKHTARKER